MSNETSKSTDKISNIPVEEPEIDLSVPAEEPEINLAETDNTPVPEASNNNARKSGFETLVGSMTNLGHALGDRVNVIDKQYKIADTFNSTVQGIDQRFKVNEKAQASVSAVGNTAKNVDERFKIVDKVVEFDKRLRVSERTMNVVNVTGQKLGEIEEKTQVVDKTSNIVAKGTDWVTDKVKRKSKVPEDEDDEGW
uniref:Uncharacterized protein n=1 Tax=Leptocylindrus danicus TaxID=163516 RepID=A0A7S2L8Q4_9STRA|mmetsp:Transcript_32751/g.47397  ORF Transcript_32751/g.47397 Transcript_32751/m.47397 type:complete len:196 (+) Transcript_32751:332-919(+)|eukprot:CAMPEP_0116030952 /NCGR_PEP_ID=MMETSP0321-20121206/17188_1 /TAXON_ID=163516 /ORGANISM="Leptocylindrus danicus var. danicus, Strain B650" /LENGTH=195 /DNA_ID=CAMNT_0003505911 /DNA_START=65 /DNA_END=649 /DNA_ORIENTATION=-